jgi:nitroreductase
MIATENIQEIKTADTDRPILDLIAERWSPRMFSEKPIGREDLKILLEAARWSPSSNNAQPWRFIYAFKGSRGYDRIFSCLSDFNKKWVKNAPVLMLTAIQEKFDNGKDNYHALHDLGLAVGNMSLQAESMGIALHQMAGVDWKKAHSVFDVPEGFHVATAIAFGYYGGDPSELPGDIEKMETKGRERKPLPAIAAEGKWGFEG